MLAMSLEELAAFGESPEENRAIVSSSSSAIALEAVVEEPSHCPQVRAVADEPGFAQSSTERSPTATLRVYQLKIKLLGVRPQVRPV